MAQRITFPSVIADSLVLDVANQDAGWARQEANVLRSTDGGAGFGSVRARPGLAAATPAFYWENGSAQKTGIFGGIGGGGSALEILVQGINTGQFSANCFRVIGGGTVALIELLNSTASRGTISIAGSPASGRGAVAFTDGVSAGLAQRAAIMSDVLGVMILAEDNAQGDGAAFEFLDMTAPPGVPAANRGRVYLEDDGAGDSQLAVRFASGVRQIIRAEGGNLVITEDHVGDDTLTEVESRSHHTNAGAAVAVTLTLPPAPRAGVRLTFTRVANQELRIDPGAADAFLWPRGQTTDGNYLALGRDGVTTGTPHLAIKSNADGNWEVVSIEGHVFEQGNGENLAFSSAEQLLRIPNLGRVDPATASSLSGTGLLGNVTTVQFTSSLVLTVNGVMFQQNTNSPSGNVAGWDTTIDIVDHGAPVEMVWMGHLVQTANTRFFAGLSDQTFQTMVGADDPAGNYYGFQKRATDTNWFFVHKDGATLVRVDTGLAADTVMKVFLVDVRSATLVNLRLLDLNFDPLAITAVTSGLPASGVDLEPCYGIENTAVGSISIRTHHAAMIVRASS